MQKTIYNETDDIIKLLRRRPLDTTKNRAPVHYQAPDFSSENPKRTLKKECVSLDQLTLKTASYILRIGQRANACY